MSQLDLSYYGLSELPRFGKDHLALADWRLSVPHQRGVAGGGESLAAVDYEFVQAGVTKRVSLEGGAKVGLPTDTDDLFLIGLLTLAAAMDFPARLHFEPSHVLHVLRLPVKDRHLIRQQQAYQRFVALTAMFEGTWFDRTAKSPAGDFITGVLAEVCYRPKRGRRAKGETPASYVQFTHNFHESLLRGNLLNIDLELLSSWSSPTAAVLFRHLNKVWRHGRKPSHYSRDLKDLACGQLRMTAGKNLKDNFQKMLRELESKEFLAPMDKEERFERVRHGVWRVHFEIHPERIVRSKASTPSQSTEAEAVVRRYALLRHGAKQHTPSDHELTHAEELIGAFGLGAVERATCRVAEVVKQQGRDDVYFGFAVPYFRKELQRHQEAKSETATQAAAARRAESDTRRLSDERRQRQDQLARRLQAWKASTPAEMKAYVEVALDRATSDVVRNRILDSTHNDPAAEVLREVPLTTTSQ